MPKLLVFNPEHDYALAHGGEFYMAPASTRILAKRLEHMPVIWAKPTDLLLLSDNSIIRASDGCIPEIIEFSTVEPWGWDLAVRNRLKALGVPGNRLPSDEWIENLRRLSHRRISIECNRFLNSVHIPREFNDLETALDFASNNPGCYFKMPWSSGGRGVLATGDLSFRQIEEWIRGALRRQGSVMGEKAVSRKLDFASLWEISDLKNVIFLGLSVSRSDGRGKYKGNITGNQDELRNLILSFAPSFSDGLLFHQEEFLRQYVAPHYSGKLGIDMMATDSGEVVPCSEINLRWTMGHVALEYSTLNFGKRKLMKDVDLPLIPIADT